MVWASLPNMQGSFWFARAVVWLREEGAAMSRISDRELDRRLHDAIMHLDETPRLAAAVKEARARIFPLHCTLCEEIPHDGQRCRRPSERKGRT